MKLLLVDDEKLLAKGLKKSLEQEGYEVNVAYDGEEAWQKLQIERHSLIILDLMLPKIDGISLCKKIRAKWDTPIIMLTAKGEDVDKIIGLEMGADDYLTKPFNTRELIARIRAILRRPQSNSARSVEVLNREDLMINFLERRVYVKKGEGDLTAKEYDLLVLLAKNPGRIFTREQLLEKVWGYDFAGEDRTVDVHVRRLREKIEPNPAQPRFIMTKWGVGYYFQDSE
ncbi:MAG: response regulator transcription factor [Clostridia bacterium]|nr:response regulator transcription factor [Clostridia bacterium]